MVHPIYLSLSNRNDCIFFQPEHFIDFKMLAHAKFQLLSLVLSELHCDDLRNHSISLISLIPSLKVSKNSKSTSNRELKFCMCQHLLKLWLEKKSAISAAQCTMTYWDIGLKKVARPKSIYK